MPWCEAGELQPHQKSSKATSTKGGTSHSHKGGRPLPQNGTRHSHQGGQATTTKRGQATLNKAEAAKEDHKHNWEKQ